MTTRADGDGDGNASSATSKPNTPAFFPLGYVQGFNQWWTAPSPAEAESRVLSFIPYLQKTQSNNDSSANDRPANDPWGPRSWSSRMVPLPGKARALNEFSIHRPDDDDSSSNSKDKLVIVHGYGAGLGFFYQNFEPLSRSKNWQLYALDLLGMGRSSRPPFRIHAKTRQQQITEAEDWFVDSLEEWRVANKINKMTLLGHSMGGYLAVCYALKYPGRLNKLILASPVGIPEDPYATATEHATTDLANPPPSSLENEFTQDQDETTKGRIQDQPRRPLPKWLTYLWDANISPFSFVRLSGPLGPRLTSAWTSRRFSHLPQDEALALHEYAYSLFRLRGSGEYALAYLLAPGAFARSPLIRRVQGLGRQTLPNGEQEPGLPVVFMYGQNDWMDVNGGYAAKKKMDAVREKLLAGKSPADRARDRGSAKVVVVPKAGHHLYLDNPDAFNEIVRRELES